MIRKLSKKELEVLYKNEMVFDFPENELKPLSILEREEYNWLGYFEENVLKGYAILILYESKKCILLDYFAILSTYRKNGLGTQFLRELKEEYREWDAIFIESEAEKSETARKRIEFYKHSSAVVTSFIVALYFVEYHILMIPLAVALDQKEIIDRVRAIYEKIYTSKQLEEYINIKKVIEENAID